MTQGTIATIIVAGGSSNRITDIPTPKQYQLSNGQTMLARCIATFNNCPTINHIVTAIREEDIDLYKHSIKGIKPDKLHFVIGGDTRQKSVFNSLQYLNEYAPKYVLIHDGARPYVSLNLINKIIEALARQKSVIPILPIDETIKIVRNNKIISSVSRAELYLAQTPQAFSYKDILMCHNIAKTHLFTDDASLMECYNMPVYTIPGDPGNIKITNNKDLAIFRKGHLLEEAVDS